jgi:hypothetical protein
MVIVASIYLRFYIEVRVSTFLPIPAPPKIPSDSDSTALLDSVADPYTISGIFKHLLN